MLLPATKSWAWKVLVGTGGLIALLAVIDMLSIPSHPKPSPSVCKGVTCELSQSIGPGMWFTLVAGLLVAAGGYVHHIRPVPFRSAHPAVSAGAQTAAPAAGIEVAEPPVAEPAGESAAAQAQPTAPTGAGSNPQSEPVE